MNQRRFILGALALSLGLGAAVPACEEPAPADAADGAGGVNQTRAAITTPDTTSRAAFDAGAGPAPPPVTVPLPEPTIDEDLYVRAEKRCPEDLPKEDRWIYDACLAMSTAGALEKASTLMPSPVKEFAKLVGKGGKKACCAAAFDTHMEPIWECSLKQAGAKMPTYNACKACCNDRWPIYGTTNVQLNGACTTSCSRGQAVYGWPES